jgi:ribosomal protein L36
LENKANGSITTLFNTGDFTIREHYPYAHLKVLQQVKGSEKGCAVICRTGIFQIICRIGIKNTNSITRKIFKYFDASALTVANPVDFPAIAVVNFIVT